MLVVLGMWNLTGLLQRIRHGLGTHGNALGVSHAHPHAHGDYVHSHRHGHETRRPWTWRGPDAAGMARTAGSAASASTRCSARSSSGSSTAWLDRRRSRCSSWRPSRMPGGPWLTCCSSVSGPSWDVAHYPRHRCPRSCMPRGGYRLSRRYLQYRLRPAEPHLRAIPRLPHLLRGGTADRSSWSAVRSGTPEAGASCLSGRLHGEEACTGLAIMATIRGQTACWRAGHHAALFHLRSVCGASTPPDRDHWESVRLALRVVGHRPMAKVGRLPRSKRMQPRLDFVISVRRIAKLDHRRAGCVVLRYDWRPPHEAVSGARLSPKILILVLVFVSLLGVLAFALSRELTTTTRPMAARPALRPPRPALSPAEEAYIRLGPIHGVSSEARCA